MIAQIDGFYVRGYSHNREIPPRLKTHVGADQEQIDQFVKKSQSEMHDIPFNIKYLKTSAKSGLNVTEAFGQLGLLIGEYIEEYKKRHM